MIPDLASPTSVHNRDDEKLQKVFGMALQHPAGKGKDEGQVVDIRRLILLRITNYSDDFFCSAGVPTGVFRR